MDEISNTGNILSLHAYLPQDRLRAITNNTSLPNRTSGSALFADISGFTALTELLRESLGTRQGVEELSKQLGAVYSALIAEVEKYGGSVIGFAGDAMMCWFDAGVGGLRSGGSAVTCAFGMQSAIQAFPALGLKVAVTTGDARRFVVGDPGIQKMDALAGATVARTATAEHLADKGDVLLDEGTVNALGESLTINEWRDDEESGERFAVVSRSEWHSDLLDLQQKPDYQSYLQPDILRSFIHHAVFERETSGQGAFLAEFRPCVALFVRFTGIDYDSDVAESELDAFIRGVQSIASRYDGTLMDITIGDKGSYAYINFGALSAHEDDARRAVKTALEIMKASSLRLQTGITQGVMRVGAYGGATRKTFGALGDDVNLAARLMTTASVGEILLSGHVHKVVANDFAFEPRPPLPMKGKAEPLPVFAVAGVRQARAIRLQEPTYALPMVGRRNELQLINDKLDLSLQGKSQVLGIVAEAGMGKSRLVAEVIRLARRKGFAGYGGACQSDAVNTPYQTWKSIWGAFFDVDPSAPLKKQMRSIEGEIEDHAPERLQAMPLLNVVLGLEIPDNDFTKTLEPQYRKSALRALLEDCLRAAAQDEPLLIVIEDMHWIDALSHDLLEELTRALTDSRVCFVLAYRPSQLARLEAPRLEAMPNFTKIELHELNAAEAESAIRAKLAQLYPARGGTLPVGLVDKLMRRSQGNPFYLEELLNYVRDRGLDPADLNRIELPDSLHTLILNRIDQLSEHEKTTLRVASIVGRLFRAKWLAGYYPELGAPSRVKAALDMLETLDITPLDSPEPELAYLFKHVVTHEVTYENLPFSTRAKLHEQLAEYLETVGASVDTIAHHYGRSDNVTKKREYFQKAAEAAQAVSAFTTAVENLERLLELTPATDPAHSALAIQLAKAHLSLSDYPAAHIAIAKAQAAATTDSDRAAALAVLGEMTTELADYTAAQTILAEAVGLARASDDKLSLCYSLSSLGNNYRHLGKLDEAQATLNESLALAQVLGDVHHELLALLRLGAVKGVQGDLAEEERLAQEVFTRAVAVGNRKLAMVAINNLGGVADQRGDLAAAQMYVQQAIALAHEIGAQSSIVIFLINQAEGDIKLGELTTAYKSLQEGLTLALRLGLELSAVRAVMWFAILAHRQGETERALVLLGLTRQHHAWINKHQNLLDATLAEWALDPSVVEAGLKKGEALDWEETVKELMGG